MEIRELGCVGLDSLARFRELLAGAAEGGLERGDGGADGGEGGLGVAEGGELGEEGGVAGENFGLQVLLEEADRFL